MFIAFLIQNRIVVSVFKCLAFWVFITQFHTLNDTFLWIGDNVSVSNTRICKFLIVILCFVWVVLVSRPSFFPDFSFLSSFFLPSSLSFFNISLYLSSFLGCYFFLLLFKVLTYLFKLFHRSITIITPSLDSALTFLHIVYLIRLGKGFFINKTISYGVEIRVVWSSVIGKTAFSGVISTKRLALNRV
jgi:hypothetical protein